MSRASLDSFWQKPLEEDFPTLNPSIGISTSSEEQFSLPERPQTFDEPETEQSTEEPSFLGKMKDRFLGAAKGIGEDALGTVEMVKKGAQTLPKLASGGLLPEIPEPQYSKDFYAKARSLTEAKNPTQQEWKSGTQWATLLTPILGTAVTKAPGFARSLEEASLRLTSSEKRDLGAKLDRAVNYLVEKGVIGNPSQRLDKAQVLYNQTEDRLQKFLAEEAKDVKIPREIYVTRLEALKAKYADDRISTLIEQQIDEAIATFRKNYAETPLIPVDRFNKWKRSVMEDAFNKAGLKVRDDVEFAIGDEANEMLKEATNKLTIDGKSFEQFNQEYSDLINARKLLYKAEDRDQVDMFGKILSTTLGGGGGGVIGNAIGGPPGGVLGGFAGMSAANKAVPVIAGTASRSIRSQIWESLAPLSDKAKKLLGFYLLYPGKFQDDSSDVKTPSFEESEGQQIMPQEQRKEGRPPLDSYMK